MDLKVKTIFLIVTVVLTTPLVTPQLSVETHLSNHILSSEEDRSYDLLVTSTRDVSIDVRGAIKPLMTIEEQRSETEKIKFYEVRIEAPSASKKLTYSGNIIIRSGEEERKLPINIEVFPVDDFSLNMELNFISNEVATHEDPLLHLRIASNKEINRKMQVAFDLRRSDSGDTITSFNKSYSFNSSLTDIIPLRVKNNLSAGSYYVQGHLISEDKIYTSLDTIRIVEVFWTPLKVRIALFVVLGIAFSVGGFKLYKWYEERREEEARYVFPVNYNLLPGGKEDYYWVGKIAETTKKAYIDPEELTTHAIIAGSTGSGKSVTASLIVEEALDRDVPVVVFDPTDQWTGFVKQCNDKNLLEHYERFNLDPDTDPHSYKGLIKQIDAENPDVNFKDLINPGEITVFSLSHLSTEEFDTVVREIIDSIFDIDWEESPELELLVVFDEVHRLLEEYGGKGGYHALEKGAREFRKWGIGLLMASQVTADFKQAVSGNIMTEIQMQTKSIEDIDRIESKYGSQFARRISSEEVGTGMVQNPDYNDGDPWFVDFRPTYHNPHKIPDEEMEKYFDFTGRLDKIRSKIEEMEEAGEDVYDHKMELRLAEDKLKSGKFRMSEMYINSLENKL